MIEIEIPGFDDMTLAERRDALWGLRDGSARHMNRVRREGFEAVKALITERDMPASVKHEAAPSNIVARLHWPALKPLHKPYPGWAL